MAALLLDIVTYFTNKQLIAGDGVDAFRDFKPETPDNIISVHEYAGDPVSVFMDEAHRSVQVLVRDKNANTARERALALCKALKADMKEDGRIDFTAERWGQVYIRQAPYKISQDESDRVLYGFNLGITTNIE